LDIGFGTGVLTKKLYDAGYEIYGVDFSDKMLEIAKYRLLEIFIIYTIRLPGSNLKANPKALNLMMH
jgi:ubiquinone/menaquinone biosynthesis C-methylase UbiE